MRAQNFPKNLTFPTPWYVHVRKQFLRKYCVRAEWMIQRDYRTWLLHTNCDALRDLVPFVQFKKREKHPWRSVTFSKVAGYWMLFTFFNLYKWYQIAQRITINWNVREDIAIKFENWFVVDF